MTLTQLFLDFPSSRSTIFVRLHTNGNQELQYQPGDHLGVFPGNREDLVNALMERLEDAPPVNQLVKVELLVERNTALGNYGQGRAPHPAAPEAPPLPPGAPGAVRGGGGGEETRPSSPSLCQVAEWVSVTSSF